MFRELETLVDNFVRDIASARSIESPNPEDDLAIKAAIVGFSYHGDVSQWGRNEFEFVRRYLDNECEGEDLTSYGEHGRNVLLFHAVAIGFLLGLYQQNQLDDQAFVIAQASIAGVVMFHLGQITASAA